ncbi:MAG TPA: hypothetical protein VEJ86_05720 [Candidatus Binataceae bacterium]|nr:hypothetical protein [Candidatus Binataceae bacterium]
MLRSYQIAFALALLAAGLALTSTALAHDPVPLPEVCTSSVNGMGAHLTIPGMANHMRMTAYRAANAPDEDRAQQILTTLRRSLLPFEDYRVALARGYQIFLPEVPQDVYHFTDYRASAQEYGGHFEIDRPGSLLYVKKPNGTYALIGAMYSAPVDDTEDDLNNLVPLSIARWHQHTNICLPDGITINGLLGDDFGASRTDLPGTIPIAADPEALQRNRDLGVFADGRFGFTGTIADPRSCAAAHGHFIPVAFGWMVHVYPFFGDDLNVAFGMDVPKVAAN